MLVVGCGAGLESVVLASLRATVTALDHIPASLELGTRNCSLNDVASVKTLCRCWLDADSIHRLNQYDIVVGSDVLYEAADSVWISDLLARALQPGGTAFFADPQRDGVEPFITKLKTMGYQVGQQQTSTDWIAGRETVDLYTILAP